MNNKFVPFSSKTAQLSLSRGLAKRVAGSGVTVNSVLPGLTLSDGLSGMLVEQRAKSGKTIEAVAAEFIAHRPTSLIQRAATVEEVANMVFYLCSPQASAISGEALRVDSGVVDDIFNRRLPAQLCLAGGSSSTQS